MLDTKVKTYLAVCRTLNYTHAAEQLNLTQSAVSQHISSLEKYYGVKLIEHCGKTTKLTDVGLTLRDAFEVMQYNENMLEKHLKQTPSNLFQHINIGTTLTAGEYIVAPAIISYLQKHSYTTVDICSNSTEVLLNYLRESKIDCAFVEGVFDKSAYSWDVLCQQKMLCVCSPLNRLANGTYALTDLFKEAIIIREENSGSRKVLLGALEDKNFSINSFNKIFTVSNISVIKEFVKKNLGISFIYEAAVSDEIKSGELCEVKIKDFDVSHEIAFIRPKNIVFENELYSIYLDIKTEYLNYYSSSDVLES